MKNKTKLLLFTLGTIKMINYDKMYNYVRMSDNLKDPILCNGYYVASYIHFLKKEL